VASLSILAPKLNSVQAREWVSNDTRLLSNGQLRSGLLSPKYVVVVNSTLVCLVNLYVDLGHWHVVVLKLTHMPCM